MEKPDTGAAGRWGAYVCSNDRERRRGEAVFDWGSGATRDIEEHEAVGAGERLGGDRELAGADVQEVYVDLLSQL